jgi:hypothetical protein
VAHVCGDGASTRTGICVSLVHNAGLGFRYSGDLPRPSGPIRVTGQMGQCDNNLFYRTLDDDRDSCLGGHLRDLGCCFQCYVGHLSRLVQGESMRVLICLLLVSAIIHCDEGLSSKNYINSANGRCLLAVGGSQRGAGAPKLASVRGLLHAAQWRSLLRDARQRGSRPQETRRHERKRSSSCPSKGLGDSRLRTRGMAMGYHHVAENDQPVQAEVSPVRGPLVRTGAANGRSMLRHYGRSGSA